MIDFPGWTSALTVDIVALTSVSLGSQEQTSPPVDFSSMSIGVGCWKETSPSSSSDKFDFDSFNLSTSMFRWVSSDRTHPSNVCALLKDLRRAEGDGGASSESESEDGVDGSLRLLKLLSDSIESMSWKSECWEPRRAGRPLALRSKLKPVDGVMEDGFEVGRTGWSGMNGDLEGVIEVSSEGISAHPVVVSCAVFN